jgi:hypothetical protein
VAATVTAVVVAVSLLNRIGSTYAKSLYQEYTDSSFSTLKPRPAEWQHLGFPGPVIHAVVGDRCASSSRTTCSGR